MRPHLGALPSSARLRMSNFAQGGRTVYRACNYARTAELVNTGLIRPTGLHPFLGSSVIGSGGQQKRWITQNYIRRTKEAEQEWSQFAEEIKAGKRQSFVEHLEERGLIHDVVG